MRTKYLLISIVAVAITAVLYFSTGVQRGDCRYTPRVEGQKALSGINGAIAWRHAALADLSTGKVDAELVRQIRRQIMERRMNKSTNALNDLIWTEMGPDNIGGRTRAFLIDRSNYNTMYAGGVAGGLWKSTTGGTSWTLVTTGNFANLAVTCIAQGSDGAIYFGTGEYFAGIPECPFGSGNIGQGIFKSTDGGSNWTQIKGDDANFEVVNKIAVNPTAPQIVYAAVASGIQRSNDGGTTWSSVLSGVVGEDIEIASDGSYMLVSTLHSSGHSMIYKSLTGEVNSFTYITNGNDDDGTGNADSTIDHTSVYRFEICITPQDPNYVYVSSVTPHPISTKGGHVLKHVYKSTDKAETFSVIGTRSTIFQPFSNSMGGQGRYDMIIVADPVNKNIVFLGGVYSVWQYISDTWIAISYWAYPPNSSQYVHADQHNIVFHPQYSTNGMYYVTSDGGISRYSPQTGFTTLNRSYNVTQFYSVDCSNKDEVLGGTQDNGTLFINKLGNTTMTAFEFSGGDGGYCAISKINPNAGFGTYVQGSVYYRTDKGLAGGAEETITLDVDQAGSFVTPVRLWESFNDIHTPDTVLFLNKPFVDGETGDTIYNYYYPGDIIYGISTINQKPIPYVVTEDSIVPGDTVKIQDIYQGAMVYGGNGIIKISRDILDFSEEPDWQKATQTGDFSGVVRTLEWSHDGNYIYFATYNTLYRLSNILYARQWSYDKINWMQVPDKDSIINYNTFASDSDIVITFTTDTLIDIDTIITIDTIIVPADIFVDVDTVITYSYDIITTTDTVVYLDTLISQNDTIIDIDTVITWSVDTIPHVDTLIFHDTIYYTPTDTIFDIDTVIID
ncbi:MAG: hypothetical protein KJ607_03145, partial [Bacteroidetes bacterium]|nr:hypothetical protein [Bacteroidota bacterium]